MSRAEWAWVLRAEWTKLRSRPDTAGLLVTAVLLTVGLSALASATAVCADLGCHEDTARIGLAGVQAGQAAVVVLAVLAMAGEYGSGMITVTFLAVPRRTAVLVTKGVLLAGLTLGAAVVGVLGSVVVARLILPLRGFTPAHGFPALSPADPAVLRAGAGSVAYLVLVALLGLGIATVVRDPAAAAGTALGVLYVLALAPYLLGDPDWQRWMWRISPMDAGLAVQATVRLSELPLSPLAGLGVLAAWSTTALLAGGLLLRGRDV